MQRGLNMNCPDCKNKLRKVMVKVHGADSKAVCYQCSKCEYYSFEQISSQKVLEELRESPLKLKQKVVKISQDRLGMYFSKHIIESLDIKKGEEISVSVPDKKHIIIELS